MRRPQPPVEVHDLDGGLFNAGVTTRTSSGKSSNRKNDKKQKKHFSLVNQEKYAFTGKSVNDNSIILAVLKQRRKNIGPDIMPDKVEIYRTLTDLLRNVYREIFTEARLKT